MPSISSFLNVFEESEMASVISKWGFAGLDLNKFKAIEMLGNWYAFPDINIGDHRFDRVEVMIMVEHIRCVFFTKNEDFFNAPVKYFGVEGYIFEKDPFVSTSNGLKSIELRRKLGNFSLMGKITRVTVLKSDVYGSKIIFLISK